MARKMIWRSQCKIQIEFQWSCIWKWFRQNPKFDEVWALDGISFCSVVSDLESLGEWFHFVLFLSLCSGTSLHLLSLRTCQFLFYIFPHSSQDNAWDYDPAAQVWGCRDSGGCSYYCHWGGSGKSPHFSGNASSDSTNPPHTPSSSSPPFSGITP